MRHASDQPGRSQRQLRVGEELRHALSAVLLRGEFRDPDLQDVSITVSEVRASPDLKQATAFVTTLNGEGMDTVLPALQRAAPWLRSQIARMVRLRHTPQLSFQADTSFEYAQRIGTLMRRDPIVARDVATPDPTEQGEAEDEPETGDGGGDGRGA